MPLENLRKAGLDVGPLAVGSDRLAEPHLEDVRQFLRALESAGVTMVWYGEALRHEAFSFAQRLLHASTCMIVGTGVARALERPPKNAAAAQYTIMEQFEGRYLAGFGASAAARERGMGAAEFLTEFLAELDEHTRRLTAKTDRFPRVLGAYSRRTTEVAREHCDGLLTFLVPPEHTSWARKTLGPDRFLSVSTWVAVDPDPVAARNVVRARLAYYLRLPHQTNKFKQWGYTEEDYAAPGSDRLIDSLVPHGSPEDVARWLRRHFDNGADQVNVTLLGSASAHHEADYLGELNERLLAH